MVAKAARRTKVRKFYKMGNDYTRGGVLGVELENLAALMPGRRTIGPPLGCRGFAEFSEPPRFRFDKKQGRLPRDLDQYGDYWLVSDRAKMAFQSIDPEGFAFAPCEVGLPEELADLPFWLCDVVRVFDAVDEEASQITIFSDKTSGEKRYSPPGLGESVVFREDVVGSAHVFRLTYTESSIFCDQELKDACVAAGLKGVRFREALKL